ncbi:S1 family peptidase [Hymenobacter metallilatus]|uniref:Serine protease n=1 Tax=Hymenobacter metallilatus TaxID=2493666 RepID=A0A428IXM5_9BACT|nr:serine protease [Hymenobacter metallilatus]RSK23850.1 serine protease [Hymenobacter metallilatus]
MKPKSYEYFFSSPNRLLIFHAVVNYATAEVTDPSRFDRIKAIAAAGLSQERFKNKRSFQYPNFPSKDLFYQYFFNEKPDGFDGGLSGTVVDAAFDLLVEKFILTEDFTPLVYGPVQDQEYVFNRDYTQNLHHHGLLLNALLGFRYVVDRYKNSVVKIEVKNANGDFGIGTGWYIDMNNSDNTLGCRLVVTNDHVLANATSFRILTKDDELIPHHEVERFQNRLGVDIAIVRVEAQADVPDFTLGAQPGILDEIITIGYPAIPRTRDAYQVVHRGEVNSVVQEYSGQNLLVISARTSPGHSGSPVLDELGTVVGIITELLYEKAAFYEQGISPYFACIPASIVLETIHPNRSTLTRTYLDWPLAEQTNSGVPLE